MRYMLLMCDDGTAEMADATTYQAWAKKTDDRGVHHHGSHLRPAAEAVTVRVRDGQLGRSDGPFADTRQRIGGFEIIDCADLDEAIEVAASHPAAQYSTIDIRPFADREYES